MCSRRGGLNIDGVLFVMRCDECRAVQKASRIRCVEVNNRKVMRTPASIVVCKELDVTQNKIKSHIFVLSRF